MILLGIILVIIGAFVPRLGVLMTIGVVLAIIGAVMWLVTPGYAYY